MINLIGKPRRVINWAICMLDQDMRAWKKFRPQVDAIEGLLVLGQEFWLFKMARSLPDESIIVEIGSYKGKSTCALAFGCVGTRKHVFAIDTFTGNDTDFVGQGRRDFFDIWRENIEKNDLLQYVTPLVGFSSDISKNWAQPIHLLFIDGSHQYEDVLADFADFFSYVIPGGIVALHDVDPGHQGPYRVWDEHAKGKLTDIGRCSTLAFGRKPKAPIMVESI